MTESQKQFLLWFKTTNQTPAMKDWSNICYQAAWNHQKKRIDKLEYRLRCRQEGVDIHYNRVEELIEAAKVAVADLRELAGDCNCNDDAANKLEEAIKHAEAKL